MALGPRSSLDDIMGPLPGIGGGDDEFDALMRELDGSSPVGRKGSIGGPSLGPPSDGFAALISEIDAPPKPPPAPPPQAQGTLKRIGDVTRGVVNAAGGVVGGYIGQARDAFTGGHEYGQLQEEYLAPLEEQARKEGRELSTMETWAALPGPGRVIAEGFEPTTRLGRIAKEVGAIAGDIALDPTTYLSGGLSVAGKALKSGKVLKAGSALLGSSLPAVAYAPDLYQSIKQGGGEAIEAAKAGDIGLAIEKGIPAAFAAGLGALGAHGLRNEFKGFRGGRGEAVSPEAPTRPATPEAQTAPPAPALDALGREVVPFEPRETDFELPDARQDLVNRETFKDLLDEANGAERPMYDYGEVEQFRPDTIARASAEQYRAMADERLARGAEFQRAAEARAGEEVEPAMVAEPDMILPEPTPPTTRYVEPAMVVDPRQNRFAKGEKPPEIPEATIVRSTEPEMPVEAPVRPPGEPEVAPPPPEPQIAPEPTLADVAPPAPVVEAPPVPRRAQSPGLLERDTAEVARLEKRMGSGKEMPVDELNKRLALYEKKGLDASAERIRQQLGESEVAADSIAQDFQKRGTQERVDALTRQKEALLRRVDALRSSGREADATAAEAQAANVGRQLNQDRSVRLKVPDQEQYADSTVREFQRTPAGEAGVQQSAEAAPRYAYRARDVGEQGIPGAGHAQASTSEVDVRRMAPSRSESDQEIVRVDLSKMDPAEYDVLPRRKGEAPWVRFKREIGEQDVKALGPLTETDRAAASKAEQLPEPQAAAIRRVTQATLAGESGDVPALAGLTPEQARKGAEDVAADGIREFSAEAVALKRAALETVGEAGGPVELSADATMPELRRAMDDVSNPAKSTRLGAAETIEEAIGQRAGIEVAKAVGAASEIEMRRGARGEATGNTKIDAALDNVDEVTRSLVQHAYQARLGPESAWYRYSGGESGARRLASNRRGTSDTLARIGTSQGRGQGERAAVQSARDAASRLTQANPVRTASAGVRHARGKLAPSGSEERARLLGHSFQRDFAAKGFVDLKQRPVRTAEDMATVARLYRDPRFETFRIYLRKGDTIVHQEGLTSHLPGTTGNILDPRVWANGNMVADLKAKMQTVGADGYSLSHNHPSGDPTISPADVRITDHFKSVLPGLREHVVTDHETYGYMDPSLPGGEIRTYSLPLDPDTILATSIDHPLLGRKILSVDDVAAVARDLSTSPDYATLVYADNGGKTRVVQEMPFDVLRDPEVAAEFLQKARTNFGSEHVYAFHDAPDVVLDDSLHSLIESGHISDAAFGIDERTHAERRSESGLRQTNLSEKRIIDKNATPIRRLGPKGEGYEPGSAVSRPEAPPGRDLSADAPVPERDALGREVVPFTMARERVAEAGKGEGGRTEGKPPDEVVNLDRVETEDDIKATMTRVADSLKDDPKFKKTYRSWEEVEARALAAGFTEKDIQRLLKENGGALTDVQIEAGRRLRETAFVDARDKLQELRTATAEGKSSEVLERAYEAAINKAAGIMYATARAGSEAGRALAIHRKMSKPLSAEEKLFRRAMKEKPELGENFAKAFLQAATPKERADLVRGIFNPKIADKIYHVWINGLLSGIPTHGANMTSNALTQLVSGVEKGASGALDLVGVRQGGKRERFTREAVADFMGVPDGLAAARKSFAESWKNYYDPTKLDEHTKLEHRVNPFTGKVTQHIGTPSRLLQAADDAFKALASVRESYSLSYRKARLEGKDGDAAFGRMREILGDLSSHEDILKQMGTAKEYQTFTKSLGEKGTAALGMRSKIPGARWVVPFVRTPLNIAKYTLERTPMNFARLLYLYGTKRGQAMKPADMRLAEELAKPILGTLVGMTFAEMAANGLVTGSGPADEKEKKLWRSTGKQPYSVKIGDQYVSYQRIEPLATIAGMAADLVEASGEDEEKEGVKKIVGSISENMLNKTFMSGLTDAAAAINDPERYMGDFLARLGGTVVPNIVAKGAQALDPTVRESNFKDASFLTSRLPGATGLAPAKKTALGEDYQRSGSAIERFASPIQRSTEKGAETNLEREMLEAQFNPTKPSKFRTVAGKKIQLTPEEYAKFVEADERMTKRLRESVNDPRFKRLPAERKKAFFEQRYRLSSEDAWRRVARSVARRRREER